MKKEEEGINIKEEMGGQRNSDQMPTLCATFRSLGVTFLELLFLDSITTEATGSFKISEKK